VIPESAKFAIQKARDNDHLDHLVFICTERSKAELFKEILMLYWGGKKGFFPWNS